MKFVFDDESFSFETLRTAGFALYGGADLAVIEKSSGGMQAEVPANRPGVRGCRLGIPQMRTRSSAADGVGLDNPPRLGSRAPPRAGEQPFTGWATAFQLKEGLHART